MATAPALFDIASSGLAENEDVQTALEWLNEGISQVDETGRRIVRPPQGAGSWESFFAGDNSGRGAAPAGDIIDLISGAGSR